MDFHGNYGSPFGDPQAAMRYTESKLSKLAEEGLLANLNKNTVDWMPNFTAEEEEPTTLPALFPGLFCLPSQGIGYATACNFLTYNLTEVCNGIINYLSGQNFPVLQYDLASGGTIINPSVMDIIYKTGKGSVIIESTYKIDKQKIIITELPFNVMLDDIREEIIKYCQKEEYSGVEDIYNSSGKNNLELTIIAANGYDPQTVIDVLMANTKLRNSYGINQVALVNNMPKLLTVQDMVDIYIEHNTSCIKREYEYDLAAARKRIHILEGLSIALENIDNVIDLIKKSETKAIAAVNLCEKYHLSREQADAILAMTLSHLTNMDQIAIANELQEKKQLALTCQEVIESYKKQTEILAERLRDLVKKFGDKRRTAVIQKDIPKTSTARKAKELIIEDVIVVRTMQGYIKSIPVKAYREARVNIEKVKARTDDIILLFSSLGKMYRLKVGEIKQCAATDKGTALGAILSLESNEKILYMTNMNIDQKHPYITGVTEKGLIKKSDKTIFIGSTQNKRGMKCAGLNEGDSFIWFGETNGDYMTLATSDRMGIQFKLDEINPVGKTAKGVKGIALNEGATVVRVSVGAMLKTLPVQHRAGKGNRLS